ncbi:stage III sporulation protein AH [Paenisporosarcina quisquiliarum]|uniref:SpoIIIAH-like family protein n=1 Tax=Psychrobacillus psychrodurans TaxID=126157 RepID=A0A9X3LBG4_9BACI|nr:SpoIIIAH-like family protein [Psychrobacillus psychrodurans]MCZ8534838.1 SpoIIIAH-like family protein [Psychrobacillus psychrodurans]MCZ8542382.1 SpoIIIAH-like family protein [Psychrobacillus psychrodurans]SEM44680.1 stage III sporulation protein AH [Paenisporosarcina quisquiliarum]SFN21323.1 stage III sporulation protein AH [Psychrobacillus psychrodurans]
MNRKRSVWFLTLFSLVAVVTVFYVSDRPSPFDGIQLFSDDTLDEVGLVETSSTNEESFVSKSNAFEEMRMEVTEKRSQLRDQLTTKVGSNEFTAEQKDEAYNQIEELVKIDSTEAMLELIIKSLGYDDALVRIEESDVFIDVVSNEQSTKKASEIIYQVKREWPEAYNVEVSFDGQ